MLKLKFPPPPSLCVLASDACAVNFLSTRARCVHTSKIHRALTKSGKKAKMAKSGGKPVATNGCHDCPVDKTVKFFDEEFADMLNSVNDSFWSDLDKFDLTKGDSSPRRFFHEGAPLGYYDPDPQAVQKERIKREEKMNQYIADTMFNFCFQEGKVWCSLCGLGWGKVPTTKNMVTNLAHHIRDSHPAQYSERRGVRIQTVSTQ